MSKIKCLINETASQKQSVSRQSSSGVTGGGQSAPQRLLTGKFLLTYREKRGKEKREKGEMEKKRRKIVKRKVENWNWLEESCKMRRGLFVCLFVCFSLLKTTKICFGCTKMKIFYREKVFHAGKNREKWLCPLRKIFLLHPCNHHDTFRWSKVHTLSAKKRGLKLQSFSAS